MDFSLDVVRGAGHPTRIQLAADDAEGAASRARDLGYDVIECRRVGALFGALRLGRRERFGTALFAQQLGELLGAGLSLGEALGALRRNSGPSAALIASLEAHLRAGRSFAQALAATGRFPELLVALAKASELTSDLPVALARYAAHERQISELRHRLISTALYPALLLAVGSLVVAFLLLYVVPRFARVFEGIAQLPWAAQAMLWWSALLREHGWAMGLGALLAAAALGVAMASAGARASAARRVMAGGAARAMLREHFLARWFRALGLLIGGGIALPQALAISRQVLPAWLAQGAAGVESGIRSGLAPSAAHAAAGMATPVAEQLLVAGERSGALGAAYTKAADFHEREFARALERAMRVAEPAVMVGVGVGVGIVVVLMYLPIFELASAIQ